MTTEPSAENPFRSPAESASSSAEGCAEAFIRLAGISFAGLLFAFFAFNAIDSLRPHSLFQDDPRAGPATPLTVRIVFCTMYSLLALPLSGTAIFLARPWLTLIAGGSHRSKTESEEKSP